MSWDQLSASLTRAARLSAASASAMTKRLAVGSTMEVASRRRIAARSDNAEECSTAASYRDLTHQKKYVEKRSLSIVVPPFEVKIKKRI
jgi:hypothetical protein